MPEGMKHWSDIHGTHPVAINAPERPALPFASGAPGDRSSSPSHAAASAEAPRPLGPAAPRVGGETRDISSVVATVMAQRSPARPAPVLPQETVDLRTLLAPGPAPRDGLPFDPPVSSVARLPTLTLEQYASLCVEFAATPGQAKEIASRYGLTQEQWANVNAYWVGRMSSEPAVRAAWERACVTYRQWLMQR
jgi:hypothetical protein